MVICFAGQLNGWLVAVWSTIDAPRPVGWAVRGQGGVRLLSFTVIGVEMDSRGSCSQESVIG